MSADNVTIQISQVRKEYKLYPSHAECIMDLLGINKIRFWRKTEYKVFTALNDVNLTIRHGERVGLLGRNGAGKTTLLKMITGSTAPTSGNVRVEGTIQALMQTGLGFHPEFTGYENIESSLLYNGLQKEELLGAIDDIVDFVELGDHLHQPFRTYSLGMKSRLQFATATAINPDTVIVDEVLGAGDAYFSEKSARRVKRLTDSGCTLFLVSHSMAQVLQFCERAIWLDKGRVVMDDDALKVVNAYEENMINPEVRISGDEIPEWVEGALNKALGQRGGSGSSWGGEGGLRIELLRIVDTAGKEVWSIAAGTSIVLEAVISSEKDGAFQYQPIFTILDESSRVVAHLYGDIQSYFFEKGKNYTVKASIVPNNLGEGVYYLSLALFKDFNRTAPNASVRYDLLGRAVQLKVISRDFDPSRVLLPTTWTVSEGE